ncbi:MAG: hypothetical protein PV344_01050, partial [Anaplasma sp.]|nr:hypothetical protein [Anaplasma sp.]
MFAKHFSSCFSAPDLPLASPNIEGGDFLSCTPITEREVMEAIRKLKPTLSMGIDGIPSFIVKGR